MVAAGVSISRALKKLHRGGRPIPSLPHSIAPYSFCTSAPAASSHSQEKQRGSWTKWLLFTPGVITFGLGSWQISRRQEKVKMLEYRQKRLELEPINWNSLATSSENADSLEFRRVLCKGVFDEKRSIFVGPRSRSISGVTENGYFLITPLMPIPGDPESVQSPVLINRGWVPRSWRDKHINVPENMEQPSNMKQITVQENTKRSWWRFWYKEPEKVEDEKQAVTPVEVVGVIRGSEKPSIFVPANDQDSFQWFYVDVPAMSRTCGFPENTTYIEDINENVSPSNPYPVPKDPNTLIRNSVMPQDHLNYTLTWYSLSAAVTFMAYKRIMPGRGARRSLG